MQPKSTAAAELSAYFESGNYSHANAVANAMHEHSPNRDHSYLKPEDDEPRFTITDSGRRALRMAGLFGARSEDPT